MSNLYQGIRNAYEHEASYTTSNSYWRMGNHPRVGNKTCCSWMTYMSPARSITTSNFCGLKQKIHEHEAISLVRGKKQTSPARGTTTSSFHGTSRKTHEQGSGNLSRFVFVGNPREESPSVFQIRFFKKSQEKYRKRRNN